MGIYDREYYRRDGPSFLGSFADQGRVTTWLIGINVVCFILQMVTRTRAGLSWNEPFTEALILNVDKVLDGQIWRLLTYAFLHDPNSIWHIVFNMLILFFFGRQVEEEIGGREYLWFYLLGGLIGGVGFMIASQLGLQNPRGQALGASGAVTAVLVLAACYRPRQVVYLFFILPVPIWGVVVFSIAADALSLFGQADSHVATSAHLAGAAFGFCYWKFSWRLSGWTNWLRVNTGRRARPNLKLYSEDDDLSSITPKQHVPARGLEDEHLEAQVDAILEKIQRVGMEGLTDHERQVLLRASEAIKRRRT